MATPATTERVSPPADGTPAAAAETHPAAHALRSSALLWVCFPPLDWGWLAWVALVPLFLLVTSRRSARSIYTGAWLGGLAFWVCAIQWVRLCDPSSWVGWLLMALALSWFWPAFVFVTRWSVRRLRLPLMLAAPIVWVGLEHLRAHYMSGFPWYNLAHSQHAVLPLIQVSDVTGALGVSFLVALVNAWVVELLTQPLVRPTERGPRLTPPQAVKLGFVATALLVALAYGGFRLTTARFAPGPRVALLQSSMPQFLKMGGDPNELVRVYQGLTERAIAGPKLPDLIVWPETAYPFAYATIRDGVDDAELTKQVKRFAPKFDAAAWRTRAAAIAGDVHSIAQASGIPTLIGLITYDHHAGGYDKHNAAMLVKPGEANVQTYDKMHLVPFGEYVPLVKAFPWLSLLTPYSADDVPSLAFGTGPRWFDLGPYRIAPAICFEDTVPHVARRFFSEAPDGREPDLLVNLSNDGWFGGSSEHEMHLVASVFRAVELRVPLARAANTGVSAIVDGNGRVLQSMPTLKAGVVAGEVPLDPRRSLYTQCGDWLGLGCLAVTIGLVPLGYARPRASQKVE